MSHYYYTSDNSSGHTTTTVFSSDNSPFLSQQSLSSACSSVTGEVDPAHTGHLHSFLQQLFRTSTAVTALPRLLQSELLTQQLTECLLQCGRTLQEMGRSRIFAHIWPGSCAQNSFSVQKQRCFGVPWLYSAVV
eukprot:20607-Heterococcus_DN1.PRE.1